VRWPDEPLGRSNGAPLSLPATIKGYLRLGGLMVPEPAYDPVFETYDFCMLMAKAHMSPTYRDLLLEGPA
jgi:putative hemolysin